MSFSWLLLNKNFLTKTIVTDVEALCGKVNVLISRGEGWRPMNSSIDISIYISIDISSSFYGGIEIMYQVASQKIQFLNGTY